MLPSSRSQSAATTLHTPQRSPQGDMRAFQSQAIAQNPTLVDFGGLSTRSSNTSTQTRHSTRQVVTSPQKPL